jgi:hypothetical protein
MMSALFSFVHFRYLGDVGRGHVSDRRNKTDGREIGDDHTGR